MYYIQNKKKMKKIIITAVFMVAMKSAFCQQQIPVDTNALKSNIKKLQDVKSVIMQRKDISIADGVTLLNGIEQIIQFDSDRLQFERAKKLKKN